MSSHAQSLQAKVKRTTKEVSELVTSGTQELLASFKSLASVFLGTGKRVLSLLLCSVGAGVRGRKAHGLETGPQGLGEAESRPDHSVVVNDDVRAVWWNAVWNDDDDGGTVTGTQLAQLEKGGSRKRPSRHVECGGSGRLPRPTSRSPAQW